MLKAVESTKRIKCYPSGRSHLGVVVSTEPQVHPECGGSMHWPTIEAMEVPIMGIIYDDSMVQNIDTYAGLKTIDIEMPYIYILI